jgi:tetratricopeptide (TPR) repeat protein
VLCAEDYFNLDSLESESFNMGEKSPEMDRVLEVVGRRLLGRESAEAPYTLAEREGILARHPDMLLSYLDLAIDYAAAWRLDDAERVLRRAAETAGGEIPEILHYLACVHFAARDFATAQELFRRAREAAPMDTALARTWRTVQAAGAMDYQKHGEVAQQLLANLRSSELLYLSGPERQLTTPLSSGDG